MLFKAAIYLDPTPLPIDQIAKTLPGKVANQFVQAGPLRVYDNGKLEVVARDKKQGQQTMEKALNAISQLYPAPKYPEVLAVAEEDNKSKLSVHVRSEKDVTEVIAREVELTIRDLGLKSEKTGEICRIVANEILGRLTVNRPTRHPTLHLKLVFSKWFVIDSKLKRHLARRYLKLTKKYAEEHLRKGSSIVERIVSSVGGKKDDILIALLCSILIEAVVWAIIGLNFGVRFRGPTTNVHLRVLKFPEQLISKLERREPFRTEEFAAALAVSYLQGIILLYELERRGIVRKIADPNTYRGLGDARLPLAESYEVPVRGLDALQPNFHSAMNLSFPYQRNLNWSPKVLAFENYLHPKHHQDQLESRSHP